MYHDNHPDKDYEMSNRVEVLDRPRAIAWQPGQAPDDRGNLIGSPELEFGGWIWRYDLEAAGQDQTDRHADLRLVGGAAPSERDIEFPPFPVAHLDNSLKHLAELAEARLGL